MICRLILGPPQATQEEAADTPALLTHHQIDGGTVPYELVDQLEFQTGLLNSDWFVKKLSTQLLNAVGMKTMSDGSKSWVAPNSANGGVLSLAEVRRGFDLFPSVINSNGRAIAEGLWDDVIRVFKLREANIDPSELSGIVEATGLRANQVRAIRDYLVSNLYREADVIDAIHLSLGKGTLIVKGRIESLPQYRGLSGAGTVAVTSVASVGAAAWSIPSLVEYVSNFMVWSSQAPGQASFGMQTALVDNILSFEGHVRIYSVGGERFNTTSPLGELAHTFPLHFPEVSTGLFVVSVGLLAYVFPRFYRSSRAYTRIMSEKLLWQYRRLLRRRGREVLDEPQGLSRSRQGDEVEDAEVVLETPAIPNFNFDSVDQIQQMVEMVSGLSDEVVASGGDIFTALRTSDQEVGMLNSRMLSYYSADMAHWLLVAGYYKGRINEQYSSRGSDSTAMNEDMRAYQDRLNELNMRIMAYQDLLGVMSSHVLARIRFLEGLLQDEAAMVALLTRNDSQGVNLRRLQQEIEDAIARYKSLSDRELGTEPDEGSQLLTGVMNLAFAGAERTFEVIRAENGDLSSLRRIMDRSSLNSALTEQVRAEMHPILMGLVRRRVSDGSEVEAE